MIYGFQTDKEAMACAALLVYVVWRSRDRARFKITPDVWGQIERFTKDAAKRAKSLPEFLEALKRPGRLNAPTLHPRYLEVGLKGEAPMVAVVGDDGRLRYAVQFAGDRDIGTREFGVQVLEQTNARAVIAMLSRETCTVILHVRDRLERERPVEQMIDAVIEEEAA